MSKQEEIKLDLKISISEMIIMMIVYGALFFYIMLSISSKEKTLLYIKSTFLLFLYVFISSVIWNFYKSEEEHMNSHSGLEPISFTSEATVMLVGFSIYSLVLLFLGVYLKRKKHSVNP